MRLVEPLIVAAAIVSLGCTGGNRPSLARPSMTAPTRLWDRSANADRGLETRISKKLDTDRRLEQRDIRVAATERGTVALYGRPSHIRHPRRPSRQIRTRPL
jgi:hypothetical protein